MFIYLQMIETDDDKLKFEQLYRMYRGLMFYVANQILQNEQDAEDAVHQAFLSIICHLDKISEIDCPKTKSYVAIITENKAIDIIRSRKHYAEQENDETLIGVQVSTDDSGELSDAIASLPTRYRDILLLRFYYGYSAKEIGRMLDLSKDAVHKSIWRAKRMLKERLEND